LNRSGLRETGRARRREQGRMERECIEMNHEVSFCAKCGACAASASPRWTTAIARDARVSVPFARGNVPRGTKTELGF
jgi:hypothetical protein